MVRQPARHHPLIVSFLQRSPFREPRFIRSTGEPRRDRGAALVEAAFVTPVLLFLVFGLFEIGMLFRNYLGVSAAVKDGARAASIASNSPQADWRVLQAIKRTAAPLPDGSINRIIVFDAAMPQNANGPSAACLGSVPGSGCNSYVPADWETYDAEKFECNGLPDPDWCGADRDSAFSDPTPAKIGVYIEVQHNYITGLFGDSLTLTEDAIFRIEPTER